MNILLNISISILLIAIGCRELFITYSLFRNKEKIGLILNNESQERNIPKKHVNEKNVAFEKIVAKNSVTISFLRSFQDKNSWKIYAIIIVFSIFYLMNQIVQFIEIDSNVLLIVLLFIVVFVIIVPDLLVKRQTNRKIKKVSRDLPLVIDMMAIMVRSGMTVESCFRYLSTRVKPINRDIAAILERACLMMDVNGIELSIDLIQREVPSKEMRMFCVTLRRSISYGNSIYDTLLDLSAEMREMQRLTIEEQIAALAAKLTIPTMVFFLAPVLVIIAGPVFMSIVSTFNRI
ncbi:MULTISPECIES: type II secretion system F family protein [unclassified Gilliamella]|uniref:type II secretion system F family protein n=1 Tax=unclassified Gilliamella TaxID=2685620 RepID=UPI0018DDA6D7|nr:MULTISPECIES: type II secretion system F family protein [unclassified Gilliamella]MBI0029426.1 type II secretion system F family protein [Gilliamella sp. B14448G7]MBI0030875.1 type II secretion system F family protein [Gilliamella sp. B14384G15]MBI0036410.1 type II secretion system F family protein [Gilliamella sp. B14448G11]MBI0043595.1 type II secretion system F family protein [Gilliamella sp. B14448G12]MBI0058216.1 type II secretion system F family protein [Gilliamella sp. B14384G12]